MPQYISAEAIERSLDVVRLFKSYREAELHGFYSLKRLKETGLSVPDSMRRRYQAQVETKYGRFPVYSKNNAAIRLKVLWRSRFLNRLKPVLPKRIKMQILSILLTILPLHSYSALHLMSKISLVMLVPRT